MKLRSKDMTQLAKLICLVSGGPGLGPPVPWASRQHFCFYYLKLTCYRSTLKNWSHLFQKRAEKTACFCPVVADVLISRCNPGMCSTSTHPRGASWLSPLLSFDVSVPPLLCLNRGAGSQDCHLNTKISSWVHSVLHCWSCPLLLYGMLVGSGEVRCCELSHVTSW